MPEVQGGKKTGNKFMFVFVFRVHTIPRLASWVMCHVSTNARLRFSFWFRVVQYAANRSIICTSTSEARYVRFGLNSWFPWPLQSWCCPPHPVYTAECNLHPNLDVVLWFALHIVFVQRAQDGSGWRGTLEGCWAVVWAEHKYHCRHD